MSVINAINYANDKLCSEVLRSQDSHFQLQVIYGCRTHHNEKPPRKKSNLISMYMYIYVSLLYGTESLYVYHFKFRLHIVENVFIHTSIQTVIRTAQ